ncbi:hypothetical protein A2971_01085 [Candidatus Gottesmanbacteria bacterium RIFCSPLOWO2_01_FULL_46_21]|uniref:PDZ domain-containing protein n=1 Tax=Candidatus Gottesmanbacteria bacterium RIFCSPLOWO2_01_FULL_46_21 TaxID=1798393 RepID=A0A1F6AYC2_9BACT|nr:MAG: hypothetical protein A2971_01085 [Candidatus Gottesmanbacteria bacterium RIFCSPLOWO2_01_FULL_46_21]
MKISKLFITVAAVIFIIGGIVSSGAFGLNWRFIEQYIKFPVVQTPVSPVTQVRVTNEESAVVDVVDRVSPAVVTIGIKGTRRIGDVLELNPFDPSSPFRRRPGQTQQFEQDIATGFIVGTDGLIITNKHVVSDTSAGYRVITKDDKTFDVAKIYRDPSNDLAILKINPPAGGGLSTVEMGDSDKIRVGQMAIAIGTALGEFRNTVTTGVISGVGRGITAGGPFEGYVEKLDNVIQTDAAINPGNSGGPLLNSSGQVIGVNTAISGNAENIGFAIPINVARDALNNFNTTGQFNRPFLGVEFQMIPRQTAVLNDLPEGAYIQSVVDASPAQIAGLQNEDIITKIDGDKLSVDNDLAKVISKKKVGDHATLTVWRDEKEVTLTVTLGTQEQ